MPASRAPWTLTCVPRTPIVMRPPPRQVRPARGGAPGHIRGCCRRALLACRRAAAPHLRLAPGTLVPPGGAARRPGAVSSTTWSRSCAPSAVDAVLVSGDVYDRALPAPGHRRAAVRGRHPPHRRRGAGRALQRQPRLGDPAGLRLRAAGAGRAAHPHPARRRSARPVLVGDTAVYPLPYLEPVTAADPLGAAERTHAGVLRAAMERVRADLAARPAGPSVVMAHAFVTGGATSDSERDISVGGVSAVHPDVFDGRRLRRAGPPARAAADQRRRSATAAPPSPCPSARPTTPRAPGWWTSTRRRCASTPIDAPVRAAAAPCCAATLDDLLADPRARARPSRPGARSPSPTPVRPLGAMERLRQRFPHALVLQFERRRAGRRAGPTPRASASATTSTCAATSSSTCAPAPAPTEQERAVLAEAVEAVRGTAARS